MKKILLILVLGVFFLMGCSHLSAPNSSSVMVNEDVIVTEQSGEQTPLPKGTRWELKDEPAYVESKGKIGVILVPVSNQGIQIDLKMRPIEEWGGNVVERHTSEIVTKTFTEVQSIQMLLAEGNGESALRKIQALREQYPYISYLAFLEASCLVVVNQNEAAMALLKKALQDFPDHREAQILYRKLAGKAVNE